MTYQEADALLQGRCKNWRKIANNTYLFRYEYKDDDNQDRTIFYITLHNHNIIEFLADGTILFDTCGYHTNTIKNRMNQFGAANITQKRFSWYANGIEVGRTWKNTDVITPEEANLRMEMV